MLKAALLNCPVWCFFLGAVIVPSAGGPCTTPHHRAQCSIANGNPELLGDYQKHLTDTSLMGDKTQKLEEAMQIHME